MTKKIFPSDKLDQYIVRFPEGMRDKLKRLAAENNRSMNAEIIARLEASLSDAQKPEGSLEQLASMVARATIEAFIDEILRLPENAPTRVVVKRLRKNAAPKD